jgi:hypothetical protein
MARVTILVLASTRKYSSSMPIRYAFVMQHLGGADVSAQHAVRAAGLGMLERATPAPSRPWTAVPSAAILIIMSANRAIL